MKTDELLSYSRISEWLHCRYRWSLKYERGISPRVDDRAPHLGSAVHFGLAAAIRAHTQGVTDRDSLKEVVSIAIESHTTEYLEKHELFDEEFDMIQEVSDWANSITIRTLDWLNLPQWRTVSLGGEPLIDRQTVVSLRDWAGFQAYFDWVAQDLKTGMIWLIDHKVRRNFQPIESEEVNLQSGIYQHNLHRLGIKAVGTRTLQIKSIVPAQPQLNKNGSMSRSQISTDWPTYKAALMAAGLNPDDYQDDMEPKLVTPFTAWTVSYRGEIEVRELWNRIVIPASRELLYKRKVLTRNMAYLNCLNCQYKTICLEELRGSDIDALVDAQYARDPR